MITKFKMFEQQQEKQDWSLILDISKIWKDSLYQNNDELLQFNEQYINFLNQQKDLITKQTSEDAWNKLEILINRISENKDKLEESVSVWDDIYDWADSNSVQIISETKKDF
jgi:hypothetical protein